MAAILDAIRNCSKCSRLTKVHRTDSENGPLGLLKTIKNKKAVLSQRWPRDARYISRSWAVAEIWPFEIIQDGGGRHLGFVRIENSWAPLDPPSPKTAPWNQTSGSDHPLQRYGHSRILGAYGTPILGKGEVVGVSDDAIRKSDGSFL